VVGVGLAADTVALGDGLDEHGLKDTMG